jgi:hypothetical protein
MRLTIVIEHVFVGFIGPIDETTIKANMPQIKHSKNPARSKGRKEKKKMADELTVPRSRRRCNHQRNWYVVRKARST